MSSTENKVNESGSVELKKPNIVVYNDDLRIIIKCSNNRETFPGVGTYYAEFDTVQELNQFITDNGLTDESQESN